MPRVLRITIHEFRLRRWLEGCRAVCLVADMIRFRVHILVRTRVLSPCMTRDTLLTDMEQVMEDTMTGQWAGISLNMTHISITATKDITEAAKRTHITSTRLLIPRDPNRLDTARQQPRDTRLEHLPHHIEDSKTNLLPGSKYPTSADPVHITRPHLPDPLQP